MTLRLCRGTVPGAPPSTYARPQECPKNGLKKRTWYQARRHVCAKARLRNPEVNTARAVKFGTETTLIFFSLPFWISLPLSFQANHCFFERFLLVFHGCRGSLARTNPCCFCGYFLFFQNGKEKKIREENATEAAQKHLGFQKNRTTVRIIKNYGHRKILRIPMLKQFKYGRIL